MVERRFIADGGRTPSGRPYVNLLDDPWQFCAKQRAFGLRQLVLLLADATGCCKIIASATRTDPIEKGVWAILHECANDPGFSQLTMAIAYNDEPVDDEDSADEAGADALRRRFAAASIYAADFGVELLDWFCCDDTRALSLRSGFE